MGCDSGPLGQRLGSKARASGRSVARMRVDIGGGLRLFVDIDGPGPLASLRDGCDLGFLAACANRDSMRAGVSGLRHAPPTLDDFPILLRGSKGPVTDTNPADLYARACSQGWPNTCGRVGEIGGRTSVNLQ